MKYKILLSAVFVLVFAGTALAEMGYANFCIDMDMDGLCDEEFAYYMELDGLTDMDLLEIAFEDQLMYYDWDDYLWAVSIEGYDYDLLPQFDGAEDVYLIDGDEVYIWFTGWQWWESCTAPDESTTSGSTQSGGTQSGGSQGTGTGSGLGPGTGSGTGSTMTGTIPSGSARVTAVSSQYTGYTVEVDGLLIGTEGTGSDALDGVYTFYVSGNQQHDIRVNHPQYWKTWNDFFMAGGSYTANIDVPGRVVQTA